MKKIKAMTVLLALATAVVLTGCSKSKNEPVSDTPVIQFDNQKNEISSDAPVSNPTDTTGDVTGDVTTTPDSGITVVDNTETTDKPVQEAGKVVATISLDVTYANGEVDLIEVMDMPDVKSELGETPNVIYAKDANNNLVYRREDSSVTDANGNLTVTILYELYTLNYDFDFRMDPLNPENGSNIQTIKGSINNNGTTTSYDYSTVGRRGQTGIWYAGICSCRGGVLGEYYISE